MSLGELQFIEQLRALATHPAARGLADDAAVLGDLVLTHDTIAEGVHFLVDDPPASVGWKLVAVNLSDLAAKGAEPLAALMSATIAGDGVWEEAFLAGVAAACEAYGLPLVGGDTIALPFGAPRVLGLTA
nr:AIR synthase related protein [Pseudomonadota bacterium]